MKNVLVVCAAALIVITFPFLFKSIHDARMDTYSQSFASITTGAGTNSANVSLALALYNDSIINVDSCSSNLSGDSPTAAGYTTTGKVLGLSGLLESSTRTLTVNYGVASESIADLPNGSSILVFLIYFFLLAVIALIAGALWNVFR